ncbi:hypothetical protein [Alicyclobacillus sp. SO9]|uniref:hypothetical protein n=1 Tax=Alicyclobacillus sp. SO9 TaxID=2665646 RepID=UPI001E2AEB0C|nr:hypothetical protein [Alicyclobacillus sp. SO9]
MHESLGTGTCAFCGEFLAGASYEKAASHVLQVQKRYVEDWKHLLDPSAQVVPKSTGNTRVDLGIALLFVAQNFETVFEFERVDGLSQDYVRGLLRFIRQPDYLGHKKTKRYRPSIGTALSLLRISALTAKQFGNLTIPVTFAQSILSMHTEVAATSDDDFRCLAPWCAHFQRRDSLQPLNYSRSQYSHEGKKFTDPYICMNCYLIYGFGGSSGEWCECEDLITLAWSRVIPLLNKGHSAKSLARTFDISRHKMSKIQGYFLACGMLEPKWTATEQQMLEMDSLECIRSVYEQSGSMIHTAREKYGWSQKVYWQHYYTPEVQEFLFQELQRGSEPIEGPKAIDQVTKKVVDEISSRKITGEDISVPSIAEVLGYSPGTLVTYKLSKSITEAQVQQEIDSTKDFYWQRAQKFVSSKYGLDDSWTDREFFESMGRHKKWMKSHFPDLYEWYLEQKRSNRENLLQLKTDQGLREVRKAVVRILEFGLKPTLERS